jgi:hypothetical protein
VFVVVDVPDTDPPQVYVYGTFPPDALASQVTGYPVVVVLGDTEQVAVRGVHDEHKLTLYGTPPLLPG